jgi:hypothetical protein
MSLKWLERSPFKFNGYRCSALVSHLVNQFLLLYSRHPPSVEPSMASAPLTILQRLEISPSLSISKMADRDLGGRLWNKESRVQRGRNESFAFPIHSVKPTEKLPFTFNARAREFVCASCCTQCPMRIVDLVPRQARLREGLSREVRGDEFRVGIQ